MLMVTCRSGAGRCCVPGLALAIGSCSLEGSSVDATRQTTGCTLAVATVATVAGVSRRKFDRATFRA